MKVEEVTLSTSPTVVVSGDYIKAGASITVRVDEADSLESVYDEASKQLDALYKRALLCEIRNITSTQKRESRKSLVSFLRKAVSNDKEEKEARSEGPSAGRKKRRRRVGSK